MPLQRLLAMLTSNPHIVETLSETKLMRRAAQLTVGIYQRFKVSVIFVVVPVKANG